MKRLTIIEQIQKRNSGLMAIIKLAKSSTVELELSEREHLMSSLWSLANEVDKLCLKIMPDEEDTQKEYCEKYELVQQLFDELDVV